MALISLFDWTGTLAENLASDETRFGIRIRRTDTPSDEGLLEHEVTGDLSKIHRWLTFYDLELDSQNGDDDT